MGYADGHPVRLFGGRLALDFVNTADWSADGRVVHEKLLSEHDVRVWLAALPLHTVDALPSIEVLLRERQQLRNQFLTAKTSASNEVRGDWDDRFASLVTTDRLRAMLSVSALSILMDRRERCRLKMCPGEDCGWLFIDETKNARRTWCSMETCGNRAKAARHYARRKGRR